MEGRPVPDLRLTVVAVSTWLAAGIAPILPTPARWLAAACVLAPAAIIAGLVVSRRISGRLAAGRWIPAPFSLRSWLPVAVAVAACALTAGNGACAQLLAARPPAVAAWARAATAGDADLVVRSDPVAVPDARGRSGSVRLLATATLLGDGRHELRVRVPVLVFGDRSWRSLVPGQRLRATARAAPARDPGTGLVLIARGPPVLVGRPPWWQRAATGIRSDLASAVTRLPQAQAALLRGLVDGDTAGMPTEVLDAFRTAGLTHLVAVSGANMAIVVGCLVAVLRGLGVRRRAAFVLAFPVLVAFIVVARPSPSVLRAAVMAVVTLLAGIAGRPRSSLPALSAAVLLLVLWQPALALAPGFVLSVLATGGIMLLAPRLTERAARWLPAWLAAAIAVPLAAQLACAPALAAYFGLVSAVAPLANLLAGPAVAPATIVGFAVAVLATVAPAVAGLVALVALPPTTWLLAVAAHAASVPAASVAWPGGPAGAVLLIIATTAAGAILRRRAGRRILVALCFGALLASSAQRVTSPSPWPPRGWAMVVCDVGQGDAVVLKAGPGSAVVVDAGPAPAPVDRCLRRLSVRTVPLLVLSHLHADHVEGVPGVLAGRRVGAIQVGPLDEPPGESARLLRWIRRAGVPLLSVQAGEQRRAGLVAWTVLGPPRAFHGTDSDPNNSSIVMHVRLAGFSVLLTGDVEVEAQQALLQAGVDLHADVLKVPHHGSARTTTDFDATVAARIALTSVGANNDYGHPAPSTLRRLAESGATAFRTDQNGDIAVLARRDGLVAVPRRGSGTPPRAVVGRPGIRRSAGRAAGPPVPSATIASRRVAAGGLSSTAASTAAIRHPPASAPTSRAALLFAGSPREVSRAPPHANWVSTRIRRVLAHACNAACFR